MKKQFIPLIVLVVAMFIVSEYIGEKEIIFPEISALAINAWVIGNSTAQSRTVHLWLSPTIAAITGILITRFLPYSPLFMVAVAFILVALQLKILGSEVYPSLSAAILPILLHIDSWYYPLSVCIMTGIIVFVQILIHKFDKDKKPHSRLAGNHQEKQKFSITKTGFIHWAKLLMSVLIVLSIASYFHWNYIIAPPLIVILVELTKSDSKLPNRIWLVFIILVFAAFSGVLWLYVINYLLHWPVWISSGLSFGCLLVIFHLLKFPLAPAAAITLLPTIIPTDDLWLYPWQVLVGSAVFLLIGSSWFKQSTLSEAEILANQLIE